MSESHLRDILQAGLDAVDTERALLSVLPERPEGRCIVIGAGKASAKMAAVLEQAWSTVDLGGVVATRYGHAVPTQRIRIIEAGHPYPDENSVKAGETVMDAVRDLTENDLVIALMSGGGSACLASPIKGLSLIQKNKLTRDLLACGAKISEINAVRKCLSQLKGGKLAKQCAPAKLISLVISDIPGDNLADVASGPTIHQDISPSNARAILEKYMIEFEPNWFNQAEINSDVKNDTRLVTSPAIALRSMEACARTLGYVTTNLGEKIEKDTRIFAAEMAERVKQEISSGIPTAIISGGETSMTLGPNPGKGGPNTEFILSLMLSLPLQTKYAGFAIDSDGYDGSANAAGAILTPHTLSQIYRSDTDPSDYHERNDSYTFFEKFNANVKTGPTFTNVNDLRVILVNPIGG